LEWVFPMAHGRNVAEVVTPHVSVTESYVPPSTYAEPPISAAADPVRWHSKGYHDAAIGIRNRGTKQPCPPSSTKNGGTPV